MQDNKPIALTAESLTMLKHTKSLLQRENSHSVHSGNPQRVYFFLFGTDWWIAMTPRISIASSLPKCRCISTQTSNDKQLNKMPDTWNSATRHCKNQLFPWGRRKTSIELMPNKGKIVVPSRMLNHIIKQNAELQN